jgi:cell filamentation protein
MSDIYVYPGTDILINKLNINESGPLHKAERMLTGRRLLELHKRPIMGNFDLEHLQAIHKHIFQDLYEWAGDIRRVDISKGNSFARHMVIGIYFEESVAVPLREEGYLKSAKTSTIFAERITHYFDHVNAAHPFREGNGRTQREFFRMLSLRNGYLIDWEKASSEEMIESSKKSLVHFDSSDLEKLIFKCIRNTTPIQELIYQYKKFKE